MDSHYHLALLAGYAAAIAGWLVLARLLPDVWPPREPVAFAHPWREVLLGLLAGVAVLGVGQLYVRGALLHGGGNFAPLVEAANQILIFSPMLVLPMLRRHGARSAWLPSDRAWLRVLAGVLLGALAVAAFTAVPPRGEPWLAVWPRVWAPGRFGMLVQVLCEDVAIAVLGVRLRAAIGRIGAASAVAALFAAAHIPALLAQGAAAAELTSLILDAGLGLGLFLVLQRSADIWWFWGVHFAMDMMQFCSGRPPPG